MVWSVFIDDISTNSSLTLVRGDHWDRAYLFLFDAISTQRPDKVRQGAL